MSNINHTHLSTRNCVGCIILNNRHIDDPVFTLHDSTLSRSWHSFVNRCLFTVISCKWSFFLSRPTIKSYYLSRIHRIRSKLNPSSRNASHRRFVTSNTKEASLLRQQERATLNTVARLVTGCASQGIYRWSDFFFASIYFTRMAR